MQLQQHLMPMSTSHSWPIVVVTALFLLLLLFAARALRLLLYPLRRVSRGRGGDLVLMYVMGSGGHSSEMCTLLRALPLGKFHRRIAVIAQTDALSATAVQELDPQARICRIRRSREVHQSWLSTVWTTARACVDALRLLLVNGPGTCVPVVLCVFLCNVLLLRRCAVLFVESVTRVRALSLSARLCEPFVTRLYVQWPPLLVRHRRLLRLLPGVALQPPLDASASRVLVTVGSFRFDALVEAVASPVVLRALFDLGLRVLVVQYGQRAAPPPLEQAAREAGVPFRWGAAPPPASPAAPAPAALPTAVLLRPDVLTCVAFDRRPSIRDEMQAASLVIAHAGTGTVLETLASGAPAVVVPNRTLMHDHQTEFARAVAELLPGVLRLSACQPEALAEAICTLTPLRRHSVQPPDLRVFVDDVHTLCGWK